MAIGVTLLGVVITMVGATGLIIPSRLTCWIGRMPPSIRFKTAVVIRLVIGVYCVVAAPQCRQPVVVMAVGILALVAALTIAVLGQRRLDAFVGWWLGQSAALIRLSSLCAVAFGVLLVVAGA